MSMYNVHMFGRRRKGDREEARLKFVNPDGTPITLGGGGIDVAECRLRPLPTNVDYRKALRLASDDDLISYSGTWQRVPESAAAEEGDWYVGSIRPPGPGIYLLVGHIDFVNTALQNLQVKVTMNSEGEFYSSTVICHNGPIPLDDGVFPEVHHSRFSVSMNIAPRGDSYLYATLDVNPDETLSGLTLPQVFFTATRLVAVPSAPPN
jgi:hypothetical protein